MKFYSTRQAAQQLGISFPTLNRHIGAGRIPAPPVTEIAAARGRLWTTADIDLVRKLLPKIANGRKTRYQKLRQKQKTQQAAVPHKPKRPKKKRPRRTD